MEKTPTILFVCTGNTCRSSMAEALAKNYLAKRCPGVSLEIVSAGIGAVENEPASFYAQEAMRGKNLDLSAHKAKRLTPAHIAKADLILVMTEWHKRIFLQYYPEAKDKVFLLKEYAAGEEDEAAQLQEEAARLAELIEHKKNRFYQENRPAGITREEEEGLREEEEELKRIESWLAERDIGDPFGQTLEGYRACAVELEEYVEKALERFLGQASSQQS